MNNKELEDIEASEEKATAEKKKKIETSVGEDSRQTITLQDNTPKISIKELVQKIGKLDIMISKTEGRIKKYDEQLFKLTQLDDNLKIRMQKEVYGADGKSSMYIKI